MKAIVKNNEGIFLIEQSSPFPTKKKNVVIQVKKAGLCRTDVYVAQGLIHTKNPIILGHEFSGIVTAVGDLVNNLKEGDKVGVMPFFYDNNKQNMLGLDVDGAYAEFVEIPDSCVFLVPDRITFEEAAYLEPIAASLAVLNVPIHPSQKGLIYGDNRIAELTMRLLHIKGFDGFEICSHENRNNLKSNNYDIIIETLATNESIESIVDLVKPKGTIILKSRTYQTVQFPVAKIVKKEIMLVGAYYGDFQEGIDLLVTEKLKVNDLFGKTYSFEEAVNILTGKIKIPEDKKIFFAP